MTKRARRIVVPIVVGFIAGAVALSVIFAPPAPKKSAQTTKQPDQPAESQPPAVDDSPKKTTTEAQDEQPTEHPNITNEQPSDEPLGELIAVGPDSRVNFEELPVQSLGSLDPRKDQFELSMARQGAGISQIAFSDIWETAAAKRKSATYFEKLATESSPDYSQLDEQQRYILQTVQPYVWPGNSVDVPILAAHSIVVDGTSVPLLTQRAWAELAPGRFATNIVEEDSGRVILEITREFSIGAAYDVTLHQSLRNVSGRKLNIRWHQYGPVGLRKDPGGYIDRRRFDFGYLPDPVNRPNIVISADSDLAYERGQVLKRYRKSRDTTDPVEIRDYRTLWPNRTSRESNYGLSWFASVNRYFALIVHRVLDDSAGNDRSLTHNVEEIRFDVSGPEGSETIFTYLASPSMSIDAGAEASIDLGIYAGPLDRGVLSQEPFSFLSLKEIILYQMSACCTVLTFQWLAKLLLLFLSFLHSILFDWGIAIIGLVIVVRTLLHPLTKKSQINIQRFGKQMTSMKPELDKLQKKFAGDPKRMQQEQIKLMREHGINPFQMLGCLPMFLQMPIWIALWAMLYLAFEIRQEPAFYGVFQAMGGWLFLDDLSRQDTFISLGAGFKIPLIGVQITAVNILPLLMGFVFFFQQKYMSPPPSPTMTPEQRQQQAMMKWMMVLMFPLFLYKAPAGLTLYIFTSSCIGIMESRYIRKHIEEMDLNPVQKTQQKKKKKDWRARLYEQALQRAQEKRKAKEAKSFKKRR